MQYHQTSEPQQIIARIILTLQNSITHTSDCLRPACNTITAASKEVKKKKKDNNNNNNNNNNKGGCNDNDTDIADVACASAATTAVAALVQNTRNTPTY